jgi:signal transduction histidine kinase
VTAAELPLWGRQGRIRSWFTDHPMAGDALLALLVVGISAGFWKLGETATNTKLPALTGLSWLWIVVGTLPILVRRKRLWWSVAGVSAVMLASAFDTTLSIAIGFTNLVVTYTVAAYRSFKPSLALSAPVWAIVTLTSFFPTDLDFSTEDVAIGLLYNYLLMLVSFGLGRAVFNRRANLVELQERARLAEQNQVALAAQAVADERRRIARELHDVVAHHISVMGVMATGARRMLTKDPAKADEALSTIETTGRATLREMRRLLDVLRTSDESDDDDGLTPQPGLDAVHALVAQVRDAGLPVNLIIDGQPYPLDPGIALTVFRIVQECLTNTLKHGGSARAGIRIQYGTDGLDIEVSDTGVGPKTFTIDTGRVGHGLVGMRERVALYGGSLRTGPRPGGGFRVHAVIPVEHPATTISTDNGGTS